MFQKILIGVSLVLSEVCTDTTIYSTGVIRRKSMIISIHHKIVNWLFSTVEWIDRIAYYMQMKKYWMFAFDIWTLPSDIWINFEIGNQLQIQITLVPEYRTKNRKRARERERDRCWWTRLHKIGWHNKFIENIKLLNVYLIFIIIM